MPRESPTEPRRIRDGPDEAILETSVMQQARMPEGMPRCASALLRTEWSVIHTTVPVQQRPFSDHAGLLSVLGDDRQMFIPELRKIAQ